MLKEKGRGGYKAGVGAPQLEGVIPLVAASELESGHLLDHLPFIRFGAGSRKLVIFPPINDSLRDVTESAFQNRLAGSWHRSGEAPLACRDAKLPARCIHRDGRSTGFETRSK